MPSKRKRDILDFDPLQSDPEDENFEPGDETTERRSRTKKKQKGQRKPRSGSRRDKNGYQGSDIDDDDDDISDSSAGEPFRSDSESDDDDAPVSTATGRRARKAAVKHQSYRESSEEEEAIATEDSADDSDSGAVISKKKKKTTPKKAPTPAPATATSTRPSRIIVLKANPRKLREKLAAPPSATMTRRTRATTEEASDFVELTNSGRHAQTARASRSKSPEAYAASRNTRRASKGLKKPPAAPIEEATQEDSLAYGLNDDDDDDADPLGVDGAEESSLRNNSGSFGRARRNVISDDADAAGDDDFAPADIQVDIDEHNDDAEADGDIQPIQSDVAMGDNADDEDDDEDDVKPTGRRSRLTRGSLATVNMENDESATPAAGDEDEDVPGRRLTRGSRLRKAKSLKEPSSDFEPIDDESGEEKVSDSDVSQKNTQATTGDDDSSSNSRGRRRSGRIKTGSKRSRNESDEEEEVDRDEVAMEAEELRANSRSRPRRRRRSPSIVYEQTSRRRTTKVVDYRIKPLDQFLIENEEEEAPVQTPARRKNNRGGANTTLWDRSLLSTFGPFGGGGGAGALIGGPWGTGAAGGVDSDSSDDEMNTRTNNAGFGVGGAVGMTPTTGTAPGGFAAPLNLEAITGVNAGNNNVGKVKSSKALADADPLGVDMNVDFSKVGGLQGHINQLKEMVTLPLLYPELFLRFKVTPPRGVLFHGPPGTGKTLLARALANSVGVGGRKITFYMRKGADALSKWVGEAEKQLRLLFEEARRTQPSIIFFDEIDGLAPVRSSKQEQIHASIVSTLLALMDGMDGRGQVIVIGATNRPDNIDPALRRPGRFDREFYFPLPDKEGRRSIIDINTKDWGLADNFKTMLAENTKGYGGADLRALCTEAALNAIQRTYPQIYSAPDKLIVNPEKIDIHATDFMLSMNKMIPSSERSAAPAWAPLPKAVAPLLSDQLARIQSLLDDIMPRRKKTTALEEAMFEPFQDADHGFGRENMVQEFERSRTFRPRLLLTGVGGMGQSYLAAAILHHFEGVHVQSFDIPILLGDGRPIEQVIVGLFVEVKRHKPAVLYLPNVEVWYESLTPSAYITFTTMLRTISPNDPVLVLATAECERDEVPTAVLTDIFGYSSKNRFALQKPSKENRREYFLNFLKHAIKNPNEFPDPASRKKRILEELPIAPPPPPKVMTKEEIAEEKRKDLLQLNFLKVQLQPIMDQLKKYKKFRQPVILESQIAYLWQEADPNYVQPDIIAEEARPFVIAHDKDGISGLLERATNKFYYNLDLTTIEERLSNGYYARPKDFQFDVVSMAKDAKNLGDKERLLKANELATNVQVDVAETEARLAQINWEELYQRQMKRVREAREKAEKKKVGLAIFGAATGGLGGDALPAIGSDLVQEVTDDSNDDKDGDAPAGQQQMQTQARFQLMDRPADATPLSSNGHASHLTNGNSNGHSVPSSALTNGEDVEMTGSGFPAPPPPPQWPRPSGLDTAGNTQMSQVSALTNLPPGMSPSGILNEASTTKTSDPSENRSSAPWSTQATNGVHGTGAGNGASMRHGLTVAGAAGGSSGIGGAGAADPDGSQIPDTQSIFGSLPQSSSSHEWVHSQMHALGKADFDTSKSSGADDSAANGSALGLSSSPVQPTAGQPLGPPPVPVQIKDQNENDSHLSSQGFPISVPESSLDPVLDTILDRTSGCTVDQLEQISREIMDYIWTSRHERNRSRVINNLSKVFNSTISDMEKVQGLGPSSSQEQ